MQESFIERIAERVGKDGRAAAVFGEPVERDGVTVIPVASIRYGFGGGNGGNREERGGGSGGGGGVSATPVGYIEIVAGQTRFEPIGFPMAKLILPLAGMIAGLVALNHVLRTFRG